MLSDSGPALFFVPLPNVAFIPNAHRFSPEGLNYFSTGELGGVPGEVGDSLDLDGAGNDQAQVLMFCARRIQP